MKKLILAMFGILGAAMILFAFLPSRKQVNSRRADVRQEDARWFCYPDSN
jgi:hypothetical protein